MREADRVAIARELLGSVVDDLGSVVDDNVVSSAPVEITGNNPVAEAATGPLPHPTKASRPRAPVLPTASSLAHPVARPEAPTKLASMNTGVSRERTDPGAPSAAKITEVQRLLTILGYQTGIDGFSESVRNLPSDLSSNVAVAMWMDASATRLSADSGRR
jgi:hypothetical protein